MTDAPIRVLHLMPNLDPVVGTGPAVVLSELAREQRRQGLDVTVITTDSPGVSEEHTRPLRELGIKLHFTGPGRGPFKVGPTSRAVIRRVLEEGVDLVHVHSLWLHLPHCGASEARRAFTPYMFSAHGMLEPWALKKGRLRKRVHLFLKGRRDLENAAAIHATANLEARNIADLHLGNPVIAVPIGVDLERYADQPRVAEVATRWPALAGKRLALFLGRIDPVKGTMNLARAWGAIARDFPDWRLVIAGADWQGHKATFEAALQEHGGRGTTEFLGPVYGQDKYNLLSASDLMVQPSFQENFGLSIAESLASGRPVLTTKGTPWHILQDRSAGWWIEIGAAPLEQALRGALSQPRGALDEMGRRGRELVEERYTWPRVTRSMTRAYEWLLGRSGRPEGAYLPGETIPD
jgi:glycosyltransferase involved in cell wall biosynthesis